MFGLSPGTWIIVLTAGATYVALLASWLLAIPARRAATLQGDITAIEVEFSDEPLLRATQQRAVANIRRRVARTAGIDRRHIRRGVALLALSLATFTAAVAVQIRTEVECRQPRQAGPK
jgi:hypothetical protein